jgi:hypothetical protein
MTPQKRLAWAGVLFSATLAASTPAQAKIEPMSVFKERGGPLTTGTWSCKQMYNQAGYTYKVVEINSTSQYAWVHGGKTNGAMSYDSKSGKISFKSGPLGKGFEAFYGKRSDGTPIVILVDTDMAPKADAYDYCVRRVS